MLNVSSLPSSSQTQHLKDFQLKFYACAFKQNYIYNLSLSLSLSHLNLEIVDTKRSHEAVIAISLIGGHSDKE